MAVLDPPRLLILCLGGLLAAAAPPAPGSFLRADDDRVARIGYRLASARLPECTERVPATGMLLHHLAEYDGKGRRLMLDAWPLDRGPGVLAVVASSPAAAAGLRAGDVLAAVDGAAFPSPEAIAAIRDDDARRAAIEAAEAAVELRLARGPASLTILRDGGERAIRLAAPPGCAVRVRLARSTQPNAFANGRYAIVTTKVMEFAPSDDELAVVLAHEAAHNILGHKQRLDEQNVARGLFRRFGKNAARIRATEEEADRLAVRLMWAAGYDPAAAIPFWRRFYARYDSPQLFRTHPGLRARERLIEDAIAQLPPRSDLGAQRPKLGEGALRQR